MTLPVDPSRYAIYLGIMASMAAFPGPSNLLCVALGMQRGRRAALAAAVGMNGATLLWYLGAAVGLGAVIASYPGVFRWLSVGGALYLLWLAAQALRAAVSQTEGVGHVKLRPGRSALADGFLVQIANPKIILFFVAVLPPFIDPARPLLPQLILFAVATIGFDALFMATYGVAGSALASRMQSPAFRRIFNLTVAAFLITAAILVGLNR
jgi:threonine/homoserine/homoserine lactone efflux protein